MFVYILCFVCIFGLSSPPVRQKTLPCCCYCFTHYYCHMQIGNERIFQIDQVPIHIKTFQKPACGSPGTEFLCLFLSKLSNTRLQICTLSTRRASGTHINHLPLKHTQITVSLYLKMTFLLVLFPDPDFPLSARFMRDLLMIVTNCVETFPYSLICDSVGLH